MLAVHALAILLGCCLAAPTDVYDPFAGSSSVSSLWLNRFPPTKIQDNPVEKEIKQLVEEAVTEVITKVRSFAIRVERRNR